MHFYAVSACFCGVNSIHLFFMFPRLEEGGLATYRAALVQNQHLTVLAEVDLPIICLFSSSVHEFGVNRL